MSNEKKRLKSALDEAILLLAKRRYGFSQV